MVRAYKKDAKKYDLVNMRINNNVYSLLLVQIDSLRAARVSDLSQITIVVINFLEQLEI